MMTGSRLNVSLFHTPLLPVACSAYPLYMSEPSLPGVMWHVVPPGADSPRIFSTTKSESNQGFGLALPHFSQGILNFPLLMLKDSEYFSYHTGQGCPLGQYAVV